MVISQEANGIGCRKVHYEVAEAKDWDRKWDVWQIECRKCAEPAMPYHYWMWDWMMTGH